MPQHKLDHDRLERIKREHADLGRQVAELRTALSDEGNFDRLTTLLGSLKDELVEHFEIEEGGGYFHEVVAFAPRLNSRAEFLLNQHKEMLQQLVAVCKSAMESSGRDWRRTVNHVNEFIDTLIEHEREENALILDAYDQDIGAQD
jgi:iron-sulfur cluster repair protein YtfE (RIC family)